MRRCREAAARIDADARHQPESLAFAEGRRVEAGDAAAYPCRRPAATALAKQMIGSFHLRRF